MAPPHPGSMSIGQVGDSQLFPMFRHLRMRLFVFLALFGCLNSVLAQDPLGWRVYRAGDGLSESACGSVSVAPGGKVYAHHFNLPLVSELDGYDVRRIPAPDIGPTRVYGSRSGQVWGVVPAGLAEYRNGDWTVHPVEEIASEFLTRNPRYTDPLPLCVVRQGVVLVLLPGQLMLFNAENFQQPRKTTLRKSADSQVGRFLGMGLARDGSLWVTAERGVARIEALARNVSAESKWTEFPSPRNYRARNFQQPQEDSNGGLTLLADSLNGEEKLAVHFQEGVWHDPMDSGMRLRGAWRGPEGNFWAMSLRAIRRQAGGQQPFVPVPDISARQYFDVALEPGGAFWLATSDGLFRHAPPSWQRPPEGGKSLAHCLTAEEQGGIWFASGSSLCHATNGGIWQCRLPAGVVDAQSVRGLHVVRGHSLVLETEEKLFAFEQSSGSWREVVFPLPALVTSARAPAKQGTERETDPQAGILERKADPSFRILGLLRNQTLLVQWNLGGSAPALESFDGVKWDGWAWPGSEPGIGKLLGILHMSQSGDVWVSGELGLGWWRNGEWRRFMAPERFPEGVIGFVELTGGHLACATRDQVWEFDGRNWTLLRGGLDQVNRICRTSDGSLWVASNSGLFCWRRGIWLEQGMQEGLPDSSVRDLCEDGSGRLWVGTPSGLATYHPEADQDPPHTTIRKMSGTPSTDEGSVIIGLSAQDKWKSTPRDRLVYSHRLDDQEWSPFSDLSEVYYSDLSAGKHVFQARAMDRNFNIEPDPSRLEFNVVLPWYREPRLVIIVLLGGAAVIFFAGLAFNRHLRLMRSHAEVERKVAERTRELEAASHALAQSQKMMALGTLAAGVAHDFNSILSIIKGSAQIIEDNMQNPAKIHVRVDRIKTVVEQGAGLVKAMLGYSRSDAAVEVIPDLNDLVNSAIRLVVDRFTTEGWITFEPGPAVFPVNGSPDLIQQILVNFVLNAADSTTGQPRVVIRTRHWKGAAVEELAVMPEPAPAYVVLEVQDWGCGVPPEILPRIFEPFFTTKAFSTRRGTGLGLSMVYEMARKMGAGLSVASVVNQGSTFSVILPSNGVSEKSAHPVQAQTTMGPPRLNKGNQPK